MKGGSESWGGDWAETINTVILSEEDDKTTISLRVLYPSKEARDAAFQTGMKEGMSESFDRLAEYLRTMAGGSPEGGALSPLVWRKPRPLRAAARRISGRTYLLR